MKMRSNSSGHDSDGAQWLRDGERQIWMELVEKVTDTEGGGGGGEAIKKRGRKNGRRQMTVGGCTGLRLDD